MKSREDIRVKPLRNVNTAMTNPFELPNSPTGFALRQLECHGQIDKKGRT